LRTKQPCLFAIHEDLSFRQRKAISRKVRAGDE